MTYCAGKCTYEPGGRCIVSLSEPLLKYRSSKELKETILHELIHAYLFFTSNNEDRNSHGKEFCYHMNRINKLSNLNITIYHNFHDEVNYYRKHVWRCDGLCRNKPPYFGYVKRSINRKPGPGDTWWPSHRQLCGGNFIREFDSEVVLKAAKSSKISVNSESSRSEEKEVVEIIEVSD
ncbi:SprT domain-containing protein [Cryptosporidium felis]|nr:SprT domain-containing protein [Cryptosporidium felis]